MIELLEEDTRADVGREGNVDALDLRRKDNSKKRILKEMIIPKMGNS